MTANADPRDDLKRLEPWLDDIDAGRHDAHAEGVIPLAVLAAVCLRETWAGWAPGYYPPGHPVGVGDKGSGFGFFQADRRSHASAIRSGALFQVRGQAALAATELRDNLRLLEAFFVTTRLPQALDPEARDALLLRAAVAGYNAWVGTVALEVFKGRDPDGVTTGGDYSRDVMRRADNLRRRAPSRFGG